jgi:hypothetical protein
MGRFELAPCRQFNTIEIARMKKAKYQTAVFMMASLTSGRLSKVHLIGDEILGRKQPSTNLLFNIFSAFRPWSLPVTNTPSRPLHPTPPC